MLFFRLKAEQSMGLQARALDSRGSRFLILIFLQFAIDGKNYSMTKVEKVDVFLCGNEFF
jgi:hypothetical protein